MKKKKDDHANVMLMLKCAPRGMVMQEKDVPDSQIHMLPMTAWGIQIKSSTVLRGMHDCQLYSVTQGQISVPFRVVARGLCVVAWSHYRA